MAPVEAEAGSALPLIAYERGGASETTILPAPLERDWMDAVAHRFVYRCLPLLIANQSGWLVLNTYVVAATWNGGMRPEDITLEYLDDAPGRTHYALSHFGAGVVTFSLPYLFRTPPGFNLHVRGPANLPKDGIAALEGIVETDWSDATFTMNWRFTRPGQRVVFEQDEPIAMLVPVRRGDVERFRPVYRAIERDPATEAGFVAFVDSRGQFIKDLRSMEPEAGRSQWQKHYMRGETVLGRRAVEHQTSVSLARFVDEQADPEEG